MENVYIPDNLKFSSDCEYYQAMANNITRTMGKIDWTDTGPVVGNTNVSYCFMYPPIFDVQDSIKRLNDPMQDNHVIVLTTEQCLKLSGYINMVDEDFKNKLMKILEKYEQL